MNKMEIICYKCGKRFDKYQQLRFTFITSSPYVKCPYCKAKRYLNLEGVKKLALFKIPENVQSKQKQETGPNLKLKKGQTIQDLINEARRLVMEKLGNYKDVSKCITDINDLKKFFDETPDGTEIGFDTETTGLNFYQDQIVGLSLCNGKDALYVPINHKSAIYGTKLRGQIPEDDIRNLFKDMTTNRNYNWLYHNSKFDLGVMRTFLGFDMPAPYWDTMLVSFLFNQDEEHSLKFQYNKYIATEDEGVNRFDTLFKGVTFDYVPLDIATIYAGKDALMTYELFKYQKNKIEQPGMEGLKTIWETIEKPLIPILSDMNRCGVNINMGMLDNLYQKYAERLAIAENQVQAEIDKYKDKIEEYKVKHYNHKLSDPIMISSPMQLSILFYDIIGYKTKSGKGTGVSELQEINSPLTNALLEYRKMSKMIDAFLVALPKKVEPSDGKIHTTLNQIGAATGRFASSEPNLQQIPSRGEGKEIRRIFGATKGYIMMSSDFSQLAA